VHVTCEFHATVREAVGTKRLERDVAARTRVRDLLDDLDREHEGLGPLVFDSEGRVRANVNLLVNGTPVRDRDGPETALTDGDTLVVAPAVAGGRSRGALPFALEAVALGNTAFEGLNNAYVLGTEPGAETTLVDTGIRHPETQGQLEDGLAALDLTFADVDRVLLTHWHQDHAGLAGVVQDASGCPVHVHEADAEYVAERSRTAGAMDDEMAALLREWGMPDGPFDALADFLDVETAPGPDPEVTTFTGGETFDLGAVTLEAVHMPGHTAGLSGFAFESPRGEELFSGDALLPYYTPNVGGADVRVDAPLAKYLDTLAGIVERGYARAWPGHRGPIVDPVGRAADIVDHHRERTGNVVDVLRDGPATPWAVSAALFGDLHAIHILHGPGEAFAHLDHLHDAGVVAKSGREYELVAPDADLDALFPDLSGLLRPGYRPVH
jgi:hydroxyacylglutathione hydrolase